MANVPDSIEALDIALCRARDYTQAIYRDLPPSLWQATNVPVKEIVNPPIWEFGHIAWFAEYFALRIGRQPLPPSLLPGADTLYDSSHVPHAARWHLPLPALAVTQAYMADSLAAVRAALLASEQDDRYRFQLVLVHEYMHAEALLMTLRTLGLALPTDLANTAPILGFQAGDISLPGGEITLGTASGRSFQFDNEKPGQRVVVEPFSIAASPVSTSEWAAFCQSTEYANPRHWSDEGWAWRASHERESVPAHRSQFAMHVNLYEAEAYCRAANRRLPTEAEWEFAAIYSPEFAATTGQVWEWTASPFVPFPGFRADLYADYSQPWFYTHQVLKGGSFAAHPALKYPQYRNFFMPKRRDMFCGFRTCALR